tara:strand:+ start:80 stop:232 length:153 start_codon:yes stop_codon:yes gene_type:complete
MWQAGALGEGACRLLCSYTPWRYEGEPGVLSRDEDIFEGLARLFCDNLLV